MKQMFLNQKKKVDLNNINILKNYNHKFAGGWFTLYSSDLSKFMEIPKNLNNFYHNDLYYQEKFKKLSQKSGYDIPQYIIQNCMVAEDRKYYHKNEFIHSKYLPYQKNRPHMGDPNKVIKNVRKELNKI